MPEDNSFIINTRLPSLNDYINANRAHWSQGRGFKATVEAGILWEIKAARNAGRLRPVVGPAIIAFEWHERDKRRDLDNIFSAKKYILDAMQTAGIIANDNRKCVKGLRDTIVDDSRDFVKVTIYAAE